MGPIPPTNPSHEEVQSAVAGLEGLQAEPHRDSQSNRHLNRYPVDLRGVTGSTYYLELLRSLLMNLGTVITSGEAGCYACFISAHGRRGKFLSSNEINEVIALLLVYIKALDLCQRHQECDNYVASQESSS